MKILMYNEQDAKIARQFLQSISSAIPVPKMNKQVILNSLRDTLSQLQWELYFDKAEAAALWDKCDKAKPVTTAEYYSEYKQFKNRIQSTQTKLKTLRETIRQVKKLK